MPIWVADYVLGTYGSGAIMAVPAHDKRDWEFAQAFSLPVRQVVEGGPDAELPITGAEEALMHADRFGRGRSVGCCGSSWAHHMLMHVHLQSRAIEWRATTSASLLVLRDTLPAASSSFGKFHQADPGWLLPGMHAASSVGACACVKQTSTVRAWPVAKLEHACPPLRPSALCRARALHQLQQRRAAAGRPAHRRGQDCSHHLGEGDRPWAGHRQLQAPGLALRPAEVLGRAHAADLPRRLPGAHGWLLWLPTRRRL